MTEWHFVSVTQAERVVDEIEAGRHGLIPDDSAHRLHNLCRGLRQVADDGEFRAVARDRRRSLRAFDSTRFPFQLDTLDRAPVAAVLLNGCRDDRPGVDVEAVAACRRGKEIEGETVGGLEDGSPPPAPWAGGRRG